MAETLEDVVRRILQEAAPQGLKENYDHFHPEMYRVGEIHTDDAIAQHVLQPDPHGQYQKESEKGQPGGYPGLDAGGFLLEGQIPPEIARDAEVVVVVAAAVAAHEAAEDPHVPHYLNRARLLTDPVLMLLMSGA